MGLKKDVTMPWPANRTIADISHPTITALFTSSVHFLGRVFHKPD